MIFVNTLITPEAPSPLPYPVPVHASDHSRSSGKNTNTHRAPVNHGKKQPGGSQYQLSCVNLVKSRGFLIPL